MTNEPRLRIARARRERRMEGRLDRDDWQDYLPGARRSEVVARSKPGQSRLERRSPARTVVMSFLILIGIGTVLLMLPGMQAGGGRTPLLAAAFTATSAACVTGLNVLDPATHWTTLGQATILLLIQVGGFGIQALGTLWILLLHRRLGTNSRMATQAETGAMTPGDVRRVLVTLVAVTVVVEVTIALLLTLRFWTAYDMGLGKAAWWGVFHSVSAFNNAGFALRSDSLMTIGQDFFIVAPIAIAIVLGGLGFLVIAEIVSRATGHRGLLPRRRKRTVMDVAEITARGEELARRSRYRVGDAHPERLGFRNPIPLSLHTRLMLVGTGLAIAVGSIGVGLFEWANPKTLGPLGFLDKVMQSLFTGGVTPRTAGFNTVDYEQVRPATRFLTDVMMFIGAGSGSTGGGVKITTVVVLLVAVMAEVRGHRDVTALDRRIPESTVRVAIAVVMVSVGAVVVGTMALTWLANVALDAALFEVISALATVGLSANLTPQLTMGAQILVIGLMFLGRVGPLTLASSLTMNTTSSEYRLPEGRPMIG